MKKIMFLLMAVSMIFLQGIISLPFQTSTVQAKEAKKYYEEEEDDDAWERQAKEQYAPSFEEQSAEDAALLERQQALEQQRQQQQMIDQQALFEQQLIAQRAAIEARQKQLQEQQALLAAQTGTEQAGAALAYFSDADHDGIDDANDPHPGEHEMIYAIKDDNRNGISDELEYIYDAGY
ncbi:hypothetical protein HY839_02815 [Candidatus Azambacteria bacterium]|nr:hypothetical protein [Candidatus Azambacteria bacterium]